MAGSRRKRGPDRSAAIRFTLFAIVTISLTVFMAFAIVGTNFGSSYTLVASFDNVNGLRSGDLVKVAGSRRSDERLNAVARPIAEVPTSRPDEDLASLIERGYTPITFRGQLGCPMVRRRI